MNTFNKIILGIALFASANNASAQQDPMYTHYMYNSLSVNPGYAGSREALTVTALGRTQWVGFTGAPNTMTVTAHAPVGKNVGLGISFINDIIGPVKNNQLYGDFAYHIKLNSKSKLSFGVKAGVNMWSQNLNALKTLNDRQIDQSQTSPAIINTFTPNFGFGAYYYREKFYAGIAVPKILKNEIGAYGDTGKLSTEAFHFFTIAGFVKKLSDDVVLKPTALLKVTAAAPIELDLSAIFIINEKFNVGLMGRTGDGFGALVGYNFTPQFYLGYSFDWSFVNNTARYNSGSHELMLRYDLIFNNTPQIKSPRYF
jgi:type IX secretion system PorP/SprF family membrane protein